MSEQIADDGATDGATDETHLPPHPQALDAAPDVDADEQVVFEPGAADADQQRGTVLRESYGGTPPGGYYTIEVRVGRDVWDLTAEYDPRDGWADLTAYKRWYGGPDRNELNRVEKGTVETLSLPDLGVAPDRLVPGATVEAWDGDRYRVVVAPAEREYDEKALAYNLDSASNVCEKVAPDDLLADSLTPPAEVTDRC